MDCGLCGVLSISTPSMAEVATVSSAIRLDLPPDERLKLGTLSLKPLQVIRGRHPVAHLVL